MNKAQTHRSPENSPENEEFLLNIDSPPLISAAPPPPATSPLDTVSDDDDFEFEFFKGNLQTNPSITADEIFADGQIRPVYPVFNRNLLVSDEKTCRQPLLQLLIADRDASNSSHSSIGTDLDGIPPATYCVWKPPEVVRKSSSTGSSRRRRIRDFVVGRSHSDGKEKFMFFAAEEKEKSPSTTNEEKRNGKEKQKEKEKKKATELDLISAHRRFYGENGSTAAGGRKSYLPYKPEIVGFFARVNGIGRSHNPF